MERRGSDPEVVTDMSFGSPVSIERRWVVIAVTVVVLMTLNLNVSSVDNLHKPFKEELSQTFEKEGHRTD